MNSEGEGHLQLSSILFGGIMVPNIEQDFWCIVFYMRNITLLGLTTKKTLLNCKP